MLSPAKNSPPKTCQLAGRVLDYLLSWWTLKSGSFETLIFSTAYKDHTFDPLVAIAPLV